MPALLPATESRLRNRKAIIKSFFEIINLCLNFDSHFGSERTADYSSGTQALTLAEKSLKKPSEPDDNDEEQRRSLLKIGELARQVGKSNSIIRHWTKEGLLDVAEITESGYQLYSPRDGGQGEADSGAAGETAPDAGGDSWGDCQRGVSLRRWAKKRPPADQLSLALSIKMKRSICRIVKALQD